VVRAEPGALVLRVSDDPARSVLVRRRRRVIDAVQVSTDADEADLGGYLGGVVPDMGIAANAAEPRHAWSRVGAALEIASDDDIRSGEAAR